MTITTSVEEITTADAVPHVAPNKVSAKATKSTLTYKFKVTAASKILAWRTRFKPTNRNTGKLLGSRGMVCGSGDRCGSKWAYTLSMTSGTEVTGEIKETEVAAEADGEYEVKVFAMGEADGWSS